jgi:hypothetical protein
MKYLVSVLAVLTLSGCGGGGSDTDAKPGQGQSKPLLADYHGSWGIDGLAVAMISSTSVTTYVYDESRGCYEADFFDVTASTNTSLTTKDVTTGEVSTSSFALVNGMLRIKEGNETLDLPATNNFLPTPGCPNVNGIQTITAEITLETLPPYVTINRSAQSSGYVEYSYSISFDTNKNSELDAGDVLLMLRHFKRSGEENIKLPLSDIRASIWLYSPVNGSTRRQVSSSSVESLTLGLEQQGSTLKFTADVRQHASLMRIAADTPIAVDTYLHYPSPEADILEGFTDGPWNWSGAEHHDVFPEQGMAIPNTYPQYVMTDATGDLKKGQAKWVDIKSVKLSFN